MIFRGEHGSRGFREFVILECTADTYRVVKFLTENNGPKIQKMVF